MRIVMFYHSLVSDWNHGNAHFLRGVATELVHRGHEVHIYEPVDAWSRINLEEEHGKNAIRQLRSFYPHLEPRFYHSAILDMDAMVGDADLVLVHEWNEPGLVAAAGRLRARRRSLRLLFHDTHHRMVTDAGSMSRYDLSNYDGVLAFGAVIRDLYLSRGWVRRAWTWHEAADTRVFGPVPGQPLQGDVVWVGNWGDEERTAELQEFLVEPVAALGLKAKVFGVRYPPSARAALAEAGIAYGGWLPNYLVPRAFSQFRVTLHVPRRPYAHALPGIPTIRVFEALACGIPLLSAPWQDSEGLFQPGLDFLQARDGGEMKRLLQQVLGRDGGPPLRCPELARRMSLSGRRTILRRHTCAHRVDQLLCIARALGVQEKRAVFQALDSGAGVGVVNPG